MMVKNGQAKLTTSTMDEWGLSRIVLRELKKGTESSPGYLRLGALEQACECSRIELLRALRQLEKRGYTINKTWIDERRSYHLSLDLT